MRVMSNGGLYLSLDLNYKCQKIISQNLSIPRES